MMYSIELTESEQDTIHEALCYFRNSTKQGLHYFNAEGTRDYNDFKTAAGIRIDLRTWGVIQAKLVRFREEAALNAAQRDNVSKALLSIQEKLDLELHLKEVRESV